MAVLEVGINLGKKPIIEIKYYLSMDNILDAVTRAKFLTGIENFIDEAFGDRISVISLSDFKLISYSKKVKVPEKDKNKTKQLLSFAIVEQDTDPNFVKKHLKKIISEFRNQYTINEIFTKDPAYFKKFEQQVDEILGDLRFKIDDRLRSIFRDKEKHEERADDETENDPE
ncbi:MAG: hypothetical protein ACW972_03690 [Promethearchaeota archaeon]|jgi:hypothetical protein